MKQKKYWSVAGLFIIMLVLTMPFYSAQALAASVQITKNAGEQNINRYLDAESDVWTVQATITGFGVETINPSDVKLKIGNNEASFTSCSAGTLGIVCEYISPLSDGIQEAEYAFQVIYRFLNNLGVPDSVSNGEVIRADGSAPSVIISHLQQNAEGKVEIDFTVNDKVRQTAPAVGLKTIEIVDADSGNVLQTISMAETGKEQYNYRNDGGFSGIVQAPLAGEGLKRIKVRAVDWLGHESAAPVRVFRADFVAPVIKDNLNFTDLGRFVGDFVTTTDITINVQESSFLTVTAASNLANIGGREAECEEDLEQIGLWYCTWHNVEVNPLQDSISVDIAAKDEVGNTAQKTVTKTFTRDSSAPTMAFFGTEKVFEGKSYVRTGRQRLILKVSEQGAGISADGIRANLLALGQSNSEAPTECTSTDAGLECYWDTSATLTSGVARVGLSTFQDKVGNLGLSAEAELVVDNSGPKVEKVELYGGDKDYVQSNDQLKLRVKAIESSGMVILVNVNNLVMDAATKFPETLYTRTLMPTTGWQVFTEDSCEKTEGGFWDCEIMTDPVRSGPENNVEIELRVQDTAGNEAVEWPQEAKNIEIRSQRNNPATLQFDLWGLSLEENPDYWELNARQTRTLIPFVDLDTTYLALPRVPVQLAFQSLNTDAKMIDFRILQCHAEQPAEVAGPATLASRATGLVTQTPETEMANADAEEQRTFTLPEITRTVVYGAVSTEGEASPRPKVVLEFSAFDARENFKEIMKDNDQSTVQVPIACTVQIYSRIGQDALAAAELQEITFMVPFGFTALGAMDENLQSKIDDIKDKALFKVASVTKYLDKILQWARLGLNIIQIVNSAMAIFNIVKASSEPLYAAKITSPIGIGACTSASVTQKTLTSTFEWLQIPVAILSCDPRITESSSGNLLGGYGAYQRAVLEAYNVWSGRALLGLQAPAQSLYENIYISTIGLCVPGIIYNLEKYRQVQCREILCYQQEVAAGIATPDSCAKLGDYLSCRYWRGNLVASAIPLIGAYDTVIEFIKGWISSPLGLIRAGLHIPCIITCASSGSLSAFCTFTAVIIKLGDIIDGLVGLVQTRPSLTQDPYCSQID